MSALRETRARLPSESSTCPVEKMREGYYSDAYFVFTKQVLERDDHHPRVLMQVFQRHAVGARRDGRGDRGAARVQRARPAPTAPGSPAGTSSSCTRSTTATRSSRGRP